MPDTYEPTLRYCKGNFTALVSFDSYGKASNTSLSFQAGRISECETMQGSGDPYIPFAYLWFFFGGAVSWLVYAVIMQAFIWRKEAAIYTKILESVLRSNPRSIDVETYQAETLLIMIASVIGIAMTGYKIIMYLTNFYF